MDAVLSVRVTDASLVLKGDQPKWLTSPNGRHQPLHIPSCFRLSLCESVSSASVAPRTSSILIIRLLPRVWKVDFLSPLHSIGRFFICVGLFSKKNACKPEAGTLRPNYR
mmetsp:Transcript_20038/g.43628  ORF Transcript_20038/g.43628 Transcript_20038/m.43628 type:complete len:110 (-) Transcript_20038:153-482(-)